MEIKRVEERRTHPERSRNESATDRERDAGVCGKVIPSGSRRRAALWEFHSGLGEDGRAGEGTGGGKVHSCRSPGRSVMGVSLCHRRAGDAVRGRGAG